MKQTLLRKEAAKKKAEDEANIDTLALDRSRSPPVDNANLKRVRLKMKTSSQKAKDSKRKQADIDLQAEEEALAENEAKASTKARAAEVYEALSPARKKAKAKAAAKQEEADEIKREAAAAAKQEAVATAKREAAARDALMSVKAKAKAKAKAASSPTSATNYLLPSTINQTNVITQLGMARAQKLLVPHAELLFETLLGDLKIKNGVKTTKAERDQILIDMKTIYKSVYKQIKQTP